MSDKIIKNEDEWRKILQNKIPRRVGEGFLFGLKT